MSPLAGSFKSLESISDQMLSLLDDSHWNGQLIETRNRLKSELNILTSSHKQNLSTLKETFGHDLSEFLSKMASILRTDSLTNHSKIAVNAKSSALRGIYILPDETLSQIFKDAHEDRRDRNLAMDVSQVSRWFRGVAMHTPVIWSCLWPEKSLSLTSLYIERSQSAGLTIHIQTEGRIKDFMALAIQHCERWSKVVIDLTNEIERISGSDDEDEDDEDESAKLVANYIRCSELIPTHLTLPRLTDLECDVNLIMPPSMLPFATWYMPNLRRFHGSCLYLPENLQPVTTYALELRRLFIGIGDDIRDHSQIVHILAGLRSCVSLRIELPSLHEPPREESSMKIRNILPNMLHLAMDARFPTFQYVFNNLIATEKLQSLAINLRGSYNEDLEPIFNTDEFCAMMLKCRFDRLEDLSVKFDGAGAFVFDPQQYPLLKRLKIEGNGASKPLILKNAKQVFSRLASITFTRCFELDLEYITEFFDSWAFREDWESGCNLNIMRCCLPFYYMNELERKINRKFEWSMAVMTRFGTYE